MDRRSDEMSFFQELKRRNVFRVGIAYAVMAWLVLQVTDVLIDNIGAPHWLFPSILMVLGIGFLLALFFAWAFELTPEGLKREKDVDHGASITRRTGRKLDYTIIGLLVMGMGYFFWESRFAARDDVASKNQDVEVTKPIAAESPSEAEPSIAVLPFDNRSRKAEDEPFVEGVHDDLLTNLARISGLKVISRTSVSQYKNTEMTIPAIAAELGVTTVMEGAVQRSGNTIRINVQLIDAETDEHLWAEIYDRELTAANLFEIQSEISESIAAALEATLTDAEQERINTMPTDNLAAYDAYVRGRQLVATRRSEEIKQGAEEFRRAVSLDPNFALAWVGLADSYALWAEYGALPREESLEVRKDAVANALALDDQMGEAWASKANLLEEIRQYEEVEDAYRRAIELSPGYATAYHWYSLFLERYELRADERVALAENAKELDPRAPIISNNLANAYHGQGRYVRAEREYLSLLELNPEFAIGYAALGALYIDMGRLADAMISFRRAETHDPGNPAYVVYQAWTFVSLDMLDEAEDLARRLETDYPEWLFHGFLNLNLNVFKGNLAGAREIAQWLLPRVERDGGRPMFMVRLNVLDRNFAEARRWFERAEPGWVNPERWTALVEEWDVEGCRYAWMLMMTGDTESGSKLLEQTTRYLTEELPLADEHADRHGVEVCHLVSGDQEAALLALEIQLAHNHINNWRRFVTGPLFDSIREEPRFESLLQENDRRLAEEREKLAAYEAGGSS
jgi:TolB-like protein/Tfp pilus assembly protein PilF